MSPRKRIVRLLGIAEDDLAEIIAFIAADKADAVAEFLEKVETSLAPLEDHAYLGRLPKEDDLSRMGYRYLIVENYLVFYTVAADTVLIHRIIHGARDYLSLLR